MNDFDQKVINDIKRKFNQTDNPIINAIIAAVTSEAGEKELSAGYNGARGDYGSSAMQEKLKAFIDGYNFAKTGKTEVYSEITQQYKNEQDAEYKEYQRLIKKFGK